MTNQLEPIIAHKQQSVAALQKLLQQQPEHTIAKALRGEIACNPAKNFKQALRQSKPAVIAEIKRRSPSNGALAPIPDPIALAKTYLAGGANALSILTEEMFFDGKLDDLISVATALQQQTIPILRKDFIIDEIQIAESIVAGADAILCVIAALGEKAKIILARARALGIAVLVEVIDREELTMALDYGAEIIGVNNRNLKTFVVDTQRALELVDAIPAPIIKVAASGIHDPLIAQEYYRAGFDAVLIGEALVKSTDPAAFIRACHHV